MAQSETLQLTRWMATSSTSSCTGTPSLTSIRTPTCRQATSAGAHTRSSPRRRSRLLGTPRTCGALVSALGPTARSSTSTSPSARRDIWPCLPAPSPTTTRTSHRRPATQTTIAAATHGSPWPEPPPTGESWRCRRLPLGPTTASSRRSKRILARSPAGAPPPGMPSWRCDRRMVHSRSPTRVRATRPRRGCTPSRWQPLSTGASMGRRPS
mmetsp:Transcript_26452/g.78925  ORF Transcript_26452/g.78925 Transcript_26452/m.78925 type:complete len:211 (-) Transcript_26452:499-1131(-)